MRYMLDSSICIAAIRDRQAPLAARLGKLMAGDVGLSSIVLAELEFGVKLSSRRVENQRALDHFLSYFPVLDWPARATPIYAGIRTGLHRAGKLIGALDLLIAVHALAEKVALVTDNEREFRRVPGLKIENWLRR